MENLTFLDIIPEATLLEQQEFQDPQVQDRIERFIKVVCAYIKFNRHLLIQGKTIETVAIEIYNKEPVGVYTNSGWTFYDDGTVRMRINRFILNTVQRCFELQGYAWKVDSNRKVLISVQKTNQIERVDDFALMQIVGRFFEQALGVVGIRR